MTLTQVRRPPAAGHVALHRSTTVRRPRVTDRVLGPVTAALALVWCALGVGIYPALLGDEGIYTNQAHTTLHGQLTPYTYTYDHPFLGWVQLAPLLGAVRLVAGHQLFVISARIVMVGYAFTTLLLTFHVARRLGMRRWISVLAVVVLGGSPLFITEARSVLLDNIALSWVMLSLFLALTPRRRQWVFALSAVSFAIAVLSKETVVLVLPALLYLVWTRCYAPIRTMTVATFATLGSLTVLIYPLFAVLRGELLPGPGHVSLWSNGIMYQLASRKGSGALWRPDSLRRILFDQWLSLDGRLLLAGLTAGLVCLAVRRVRVLGLILLLWAIPVLKPGGYMPQMYVVLAVPFCALALGAVLDAASTGLRRVVPARSASWLTALAAAAATLVAVTANAPALRRIALDRSASEVTVASDTERYLRAHVPSADNVLLDPAYWSDVAGAQLNHPWRGPIVYYQFDLDPVSSRKFLPHGWQDIDYVVETSEMRDNVEYLGLTNLRATIAHSHPVASFGTGRDRVVVLRTDRTRYNH